jgi:threonine synthase
MSLKYVSTRNKNDVRTASLAILQGLAPDGGLYVPTEIPALDKSMKELSEMSYQEIAYNVMKLFFTDFTEEELRHCVNSAYDSKFDTPLICPLVKTDMAYYLELFHGKTIAFKDMALSILPYLMTTSARKNNIKNDIVILTATSGDTGKAALAGFADVPGTKIIVFYPKDGVSEIQKMQMVTQKGDNTFVVGINGNFDEAQTGVKRMFNDKELNDTLSKGGYQFSSANSINIGRLIPQVAYYVASYARLLANKEIEDGEKINVTVPTGNFGNILAAYYAKQMGTPIDKLICASNMNNVLTDFFRTGVYNRKRDFHLTMSPSMDILISSNLERLIYHIEGDSAEKTVMLMNELKDDGEYEIKPEDLRASVPEFYGDFASEDETADEIRTVYNDCGYVIDTHTAVASRVCRKYKDKTGDKTKTVIASTASPYKFTRSVMKAIGCDDPSLSDIDLTDKLSAVAKTDIPDAIKEIKNAEIRHKTICEVNEMQNTVLKFLGL